MRNFCHQVCFGVRKYGRIFTVVENTTQNSAKGGKKTIYLVRHGETEYNRLGIIQGSGVDSDLNDTGRKQADLFYAQYGHLPFDKVYTSALKRTYQSVQRFIEEKGLPHEKLAGLNEIRWGHYEGTANNTWRDEYKDIIAGWSTGELHIRIPGGENPIELQERQKPALQHIMQHTHETNILICMHGRAMKSFLCLMLNQPLNEMEKFGHRNLGLYILENEGKNFTLVKENCVTHLQFSVI